MYSIKVGARRYSFDNLRVLAAKASPERSGDELAGIAAESAEERAAAQSVLAEVPIADFYEHPLVPYEQDEVTRLIFDTCKLKDLGEVADMTVGMFREWLLADTTDEPRLKSLGRALMPEVAAAVSKIMRNQDLILAASKIHNVSALRTTVGLPGRLAARLQPNHPTDDPMGVLSAVIDGLAYGSGDACIGINPAGDNLNSVMTLLGMLNEIRERYAIPTQTCVLTHVTTTIEAINRGAPVDLVFQSIGGTEAVNKSFGVSLDLLKQGQDAGLSLGRGTTGNNVMYFETGQGSALSANAHHGVDQQTLEARAYAVARAFDPLLVNTVVGFIGPEYLYDGKQIIRAGLEDQFCGKLLGLPMGVDVCYTNHAEADQDDMDTLLTLLGAAGTAFVIGVPGADDIMLNYQSTSFHDILYLRKIMGLRPCPEFEEWLLRMDLFDGNMLPRNLASHELPLEVGHV